MVGPVATKLFSYCHSLKPKCGSHYDTLLCALPLLSEPGNAIRAMHCNVDRLANIIHITDHKEQLEVETVYYIVHYNVQY